MARESTSSLPLQYAFSAYYASFWRFSSPYTKLLTHSFFPWWYDLFEDNINCFYRFSSFYTYMTILHSFLFIHLSLSIRYSFNLKEFFKYSSFEQFCNDLIQSVPLRLTFPFEVKQRRKIHAILIVPDRIIKLSRLRNIWWAQSWKNICKFKKSWLQNWTCQSHIKAKQHHLL